MRPGASARLSERSYSAKENAAGDGGVGAVPRSVVARVGLRLVARLVLLRLVLLGLVLLRLVLRRVLRLRLVLRLVPVEALLLVHHS